MEALHCHGVKRTKVCLLHFRREDSLNYLNGRIPERWFCFKFTLFVLRKGKHSLVCFETLGQMLSKTDHTQGQIQCSNTWKLFPARTLNLLRTFLVCGSSSVSFFSTLWLKDCSSNTSLFSGSYGFTGYACGITRWLLLLCFIHTHHYCYILMQLFPAWNLTSDDPVFENVYLLLDKQQTMQTSWNSTISCENSFLQILPWVLSSKASEASTLAFSL